MWKVNKVNKKNTEQRLDNLIDDMLWWAQPFTLTVT